MPANDSGYMKQSVVNAKEERQSAKRSSVSKQESSGSELSRMKREFSIFRRDTEIEMEEMSRNIKNSGGSGQAGAAGADGKDGVGISSVEQTVQSDEDGGENVVTITLQNGVKSTFTVKNGSKGSTGAAGATGATGYTPVRGTDYWTQEDIAQMKSYIDDAILNGEW